MLRIRMLAVFLKRLERNFYLRVFSFLVVLAFLAGAWSVQQTCLNVNQKSPQLKGISGRKLHLTQNLRRGGTMKKISLSVKKDPFKTTSKAKDEEDAIQRVHSVDISRLNTVKRAKVTKKHPAKSPSSLFSFAALRYPIKDSRNPFAWARALILTRLEKELKTPPTRINSLLPPTEMNPSVFQSEIVSGKRKIPLRAVKGFNLGEKIPANKARHVLVATSWRSGSTFLAEALNNIPGTFYSFEPLHYFMTVQTHFLLLASDKSNRLNDSSISAPLNVLSKLFKCDFNDDLASYLNHAAQKKFNFLFKHNFRVWNVCSSLLPANSACFMAMFYANICPMFPIRLIKTVRMRLAYAQKFLEDPTIGPNMKIIYLVRDPRGIMMSRSSMEWCIDPHCADASVACQDLEDDMAAALHLVERFPGQLLVMRYEDLSLQPFKTMDKVMQFLELPPSKLLDEFLESHTKTSRSGSMTNSNDNSESTTVSSNPYGTTRDSSSNVFAWKTKADLKFITKIQDKCESPMKKLGYNFIENEEQRTDNDFSVLNNSVHSFLVSFLFDTMN